MAKPKKDQTPDDPNAEPKQRRTRTPKGPQLNATDLNAFAQYVANDLEAKRNDTSVQLSDLGALFALHNKLQSMIAS